MKKVISMILVLTLTLALFCGFAQAEEGRDLVIAVGVESTHYTTFYDSQSGDLDHIVQYNIYDTLFYKDVTDGSIKPWLAESWEVSEDGTEIAVKLREDVYFHNGDQLTAEDVKFTYDTANNYPIGNALLINYDYTEVVDDFNLIIHMTAPYKAILNAFCSRASCVMSKAYFDEVGLEGYQQAPIGTGAYKFISVTSGDSIVLKKNENYWGGAPAFDTVTIKTIPDVNTQMLSLESGDVDVVIGAPVENVQFLSNPNVSVDIAASNATQHFTFNILPGRWIHDDINFRKAVQYAIDKDAINAAVFGGQAQIIDIYGSPAFTSRPVAGQYSTYERDLEKAKEYLAASDYDGQEFEVVVRSGSPSEQTAQVIQGTLYEIGINMKITAVDAATFIDITRGTGEFDARLDINTSSVLDEDSLYLYYATSSYELPNLDYPRGQEMSDLVNAARVEPDDEKRTAMYADVCSIVNDDAVAIYTLVDVNTIAYRSDLTGVYASMAKYYRISEWGY